MKAKHKIFKRWENPWSGRYYLAYIARDLFGSWNVVKASGRVGQTAGSVASMPCRSWEEALLLFKRTQQQRLHCGYQPIYTKNIGIS